MLTGLVAGGLVGGVSHQLTNALALLAAVPARAVSLQILRVLCVSMLCLLRLALLLYFSISFLRNVGADKSIEPEDSTLPVRRALALGSVAPPRWLCT